MKQLGSGGIGIIRYMCLAACKLPNQPGIDRTKEQIALFCFFACAFYIIKDPFYLCAGEICINEKTRLIFELINKPLFFELFTDAGRLT